MINNKTWILPEEIKAESILYFGPIQLDKAGRHLKLARVSVSFTKGTPETYFIVSGIIKEDRSHESKVVFKKRLVGTEEGPISTNCDCHQWTQETHCSHTAALFIAYHLHLYHEKNFIPSEDNETKSPPIALDSSFAVNPYEYGTIVNAPHLLERAPSNSAYSSLQYLLHNKKIINFPIPEPWQGKLIIKVISPEYSGRTDDLYPSLKFVYADQDGKHQHEISLLENLYLFNWQNGEAFHFPTTLKNFIQKVRLQLPQIKIDELIKISQEVDDKFVDIIVDDLPLHEIVENPAKVRIHLSKAKKNGLVDVEILFHDEQENLLPAPQFLSAFTFSDGKLSQFRTKKNAYEFITQLLASYEHENDDYKRLLHNSGNRNFWNGLIDHSLIQQKSFIYNGHSRTLSSYDNFFIKELFISMAKDFGELFFRFSRYDIEDRRLAYGVSANTLFQGLNTFYNKMLLHSVQIFYNNSQLSQWSSRISFERKVSTTNWFDLELSIDSLDMDVVNNVDLETGIALTKNGLVLLSQDQKNILNFVKKYTTYESENKYQEQDAETQEILNKFTLPFNRARIFELFELRKLGIDGALTQEEIELCQKLSSFTEMPTYPVPECLEGVLRPYQLDGYHWLKFLYENKLGACLADDMGLGKTLQTIAFVQSVYDEIETVLIVCPVSILLNWESEFKKFSNLDVHIYHGGDRSYPKDTKILLTSYGVMKREVDETFAEKQFDIFIMDEVQHLKNIRSQGAYAARRIKSNFRICLTGTPVENDLAEFYNILDLSIPGVWGDLSFIRSSSNKKTRLIARKTAAPIILRRTKGQVLTDLPPKIENNVFLSFKEEEQLGYRNCLETIKKRVNGSESKSKYGEILRGILELRQKCLWQNKKTNMDFKSAGIDSTKISFLLENLETIVSEGHQALVFSQFTTYLDHIQGILREKHWKIARIDGSQSVKKRQQQVELFQKGECPVFLISLKAGGVGLNLTAASYVFLMDPWWNPAVESQAIDRAHRIGQQNNLTVYRPIIKGSIEEKVLELQKIKRELFKELLPDDEDSNLFTGKLTMTDFEELLS
jgi:superfamily II DNA or RNA helicase